MNELLALVFVTVGVVFMLLLIDAASTVGTTPDRVAACADAR